MIAAARSKRRAAAQDIIEPYLIRYGFCNSPCAVGWPPATAFRHLTLSEPSLAPAQLGRFDHGDD